MDTKTIIKWGVILVVIYIGWNWLQGFIANMNYSPDSIYPAPYAAPLVGPSPAALGWQPPWGYGMNFYPGSRYQWRRNPGSPGRLWNTRSPRPL